MFPCRGVWTDPDILTLNLHNFPKKRASNHPESSRVGQQLPIQSAGEPIDWVLPSLESCNLLFKSLCFFSSVKQINKQIFGRYEPGSHTTTTHSAPGNIWPAFPKHSSHDAALVTLVWQPQIHAVSHRGGYKFLLSCRASTEVGNVVKVSLGQNLSQRSTATVKQSLEGFVERLQWVQASDVKSSSFESTESLESVHLKDLLKWFVHRLVQCLVVIVLFAFHSV